METLAMKAEILEALNPALVQKELLNATEEYGSGLADANQTFVQTVAPLELPSNIADELKEGYKTAVRSWKEFKTYALKLRSEGHKVLKVEVDKSVPLSKFFPSLPKGLLDRIAFRKSALEYRFETEAGKAPGAYLETEVELTSILNEVLEVFDTILEKAEPVLRFSAYIGVSFDAGEEVLIDSLTLTGLLVGCNIQYPPNLLAISQLGATITIRKGPPKAIEDPADDRTTQVASALRKKIVDKLSIQDDEQADLETEAEHPDEATESGLSKYLQVAMFGVAALSVPARLPFVVDFKINVVKKALVFKLSPIGEDKIWNSAFGITNFDLNGVEFTASCPLKMSASKKSEKKKEEMGDEEEAEEDEKEEEEEEGEGPPTFIAIQANWLNKVKSIAIDGLLTSEKDQSFLKGTVENVTWERLSQLCFDLYGKPLEGIDEKMGITSEKLTLELKNGSIELKGDISVYSQKVVDVSLKLSKEGIRLTTEITQWIIGDDETFVIDNAKISLAVGIGMVALDKKKPDPGEADSKNTNTKETDAKGSKADKRDAGTVDTKKAAAAAKKKTLGWSGSFSVSGDITYKDKITISVELKIIRKLGGSWGYVVIGQAAKAGLRLHDIVHDIPRDNALDLNLEKVSLVASNIDVDPEDIPFDTHGFPVKKGLFLCTYLDKVPLLDDEDGSKIVKKKDPKDLAYLYLGLQKGTLPSIAVHLPSSMSIDLGDRITVHRFYLQISANLTTGPSAAFFGDITVKFEDERDPINFRLGISGNTVGGTFSLVTDAVIKNPCGLSERIQLGQKDAVSKLGFQAQVIWTQLVATGMPSGFGLSGTLVIDEGTPSEKLYGMTINLSENPADFILILNITELRYKDLLELASVLTSTPIPSIDLPDIKFKNLSVYASLGGSFGDEVHSPGFRLKGILSINGTEAYFSCSLDLDGILLAAYIPSFEIGPLKVTGTAPRPVLNDWPQAMTEHELRLAEKDTNIATNEAHITGGTQPASTALGVTTYAVLSLTASWKTQVFKLKGDVMIFDIKVEADIHCQYKPEPIFKFMFKLQWNELLLLDLYAEMINSSDAKRPADIEHPAQGDFVVHALFTQTIIAQVTEAITSVLQNLRVAVDTGLKEAHDKVDALKARKNEELTKALAALALVQRAYDAEEANINQQILANQTKSQSQGLRLEKNVAATTGDIAIKEKEAKELRELEVRKAQEAEQQKISREKERCDKLQKDRDAKKAESDSKGTALTATFGKLSDSDIEAAKKLIVSQARTNADYAQRQANGIDRFWHPFDKSVAEAQVKLLEALCDNPEVLSDTLKTLRAAANSPEYKQAKYVYDQAVRTYNEAETALVNGMNYLEKEIRTAKEQATREIEAAKKTCDETIVKAGKWLDEAKSALNTFIEDQARELKDLELQLQKLALSAQKVALNKAREAAEALKNDNTGLTTAKEILAGVDVLQKEKLDQLDSFFKQAKGQLVDVKKMTLDGHIKAKQQVQEPFMIKVNCVIGGSEEYNFQLEWRPWEQGLDDNNWFTRLGKMVVAQLDKDSMAVKAIGAMANM